MHLYMLGYASQPYSTYFSDICHDLSRRPCDDHLVTLPGRTLQDFIQQSELSSVKKQMQQLVDGSYNPFEKYSSTNHLCQN